MKDLEDKVHVLTTEVSDIEGENRVLQAKLDSTNASLISVVKDMHSLLEEHEPSKLANMDVDSEEDEEDLDMDDDMQHARGHNAHHQIPETAPLL